MAGSSGGERGYAKLLVEAARMISRTPIRFDGRTAIVTGAGSGLGREYALELARRGARVVVNDVGGSGAGEGASTAPADAVVAEIQSSGGIAIANYDSVATRNGGEGIVRSAVDAFGGVDILISNAGILRNGRFDELTDAQIDAVFSVHLKGAFYVGQPAFKLMKRNRYGRFLFTASSSGVFGHPWQANYAAAKAGLVGLSNVVALEGGDFNITSNALLPAAWTRLAEEIDWGWRAECSQVDDAFRKMTPPSDPARLSPRSVAPLAIFLVSEQCRATHGLYSAAHGRYGCVFIGATQGWVCSDPSKVTVEDIAAHWQRVEDRVSYTEPLSVYHEVLDVEQARRQRSE
jgi:NAD(P)-dependent dehydrogenase (short-subunit alcohol dehydrogenase family)